MFKIGRINQVENEKINVECIDLKTSKGLMFEINGENYSINLLLNYDLSFYKNLDKYELINIDKNKIIELNLIVDGTSYMVDFKDSDITILKVGDVITLNIKINVEDYYSNIEFSFNIEDLSNK